MIFKTLKRNSTLTLLCLALISPTIADDTKNNNVPKDNQDQQKKEDPKIKKAKEELNALNLQKQKLSLENDIKSELLRKELFDKQSDKQKMSLEYALQLQKLNSELASAKIELEKIVFETQAIEKKRALADAKKKEILAKELMQAKEEMTRMQIQTDMLLKQQALESAQKQKQLEKELGEAKAETTRLEIKTQLITKKRALQEAQKREKILDELGQLKAEEERLKFSNALFIEKNKKRMQELSMQSVEYKTEAMAMAHKVALLENKIKTHEQTKRKEDLIDHSKIEYRDNPLDGNTLIISDRRIPLNGQISYKTSDYITERISFFNNKSKRYPIFIVIDTSPGGSVMSGYRILKAMQGSDAPVYVVVKSFAASMAAGILTLAEKSFAYPNAIILHHQISSYSWGNLTNHKENVKDLDKWWKRLAKPVADKMNLTLDQFIKKMYENNSDGDWKEFADDAVQYKWVDVIVDEIRETSLIKNPNQKSISSLKPTSIEKVNIDAKGQPFIKLPKLVPFDYYYLYNPDNYYRY